MPSNKSFELTLDRFLTALSLCSSRSSAAQLKRCTEELMSSPDKHHISCQLILALMVALPVFTHEETRLSVEGNLKGLSETMEKTCTEEEARIIRLSVDNCSMEKDNAIQYCAKVVGEGLGDSISFDQFEQVLVPRLNYCIYMRRVGLDAGADTAEEFRGLINYQKQRLRETGTANKAPQPTQ